MEAEIAFMDKGVKEYISARSTIESFEGRMLEQLKSLLENREVYEPFFVEGEIYCRIEHREIGFHHMAVQLAKIGQYQGWLSFCIVWHAISAKTYCLIMFFSDDSYSKIREILSGAKLAAPFVFFAENDAIGIEYGGYINLKNNFAELAKKLSGLLS